MLVGRDDEIRRLEALVAGARSGSGGALAILGEAGFGKTALLELPGQTAPDAPTLRIRGLEAEAELPFSALAELVEPLADQLERLPAPQRAALEGALGIGPAVPGDRFAACAGLHGLLCEVARREPLIVVVDDAQWIDAASAECIGFTGRRLARERVALFAAIRAGEDSRFDPTGFELLELGPLPPAEAAELLRDRHGALAGQVEEAVIDAAGGNPLALVELPAELSEAQRAGKVALGPLLAPGERLGQALVRRLAPLDRATRGALLVAAAAGSRDAAPIVAACLDLGLDPSALEPAEEVGLITLDAGSVDFTHPLVRAALYQDAGEDERRRAHRALAASVTPDERGWQLAAAAEGADEGAAAALEETAARAAGRGAPIVAADALERAAELSPSVGERARRLVAAGTAARDGGMHGRAATLLEVAAEIGDVKRRGDAVEALAMVSLYEAGNARDAHRMLVERAAELRADDPVRAATVLADAALAASVSGDCRLALADAEAARDLLGDGGDETARAQILAILSWSNAMRGEAATARGLLAQVNELLPHIDPFSPAAASIALAINSRICSEEYERARDECAVIVDGAREAGMLGLVPFPLAVEADACERLGDWDRAVELSGEAIALAEEVGQRGPLLQALVIALFLEAERGEEAAARATARRALAIAEPAAFGSITAFVLAGLGLLELGIGRIDAAIATLERLADLTAEQGLDEPTLVPWAPDLVDAYAEAGRIGEAERVLARLDEQAERAGGAFARFLAARAKAAVAADFDPGFERAYELASRRPVPFHLARAELSHGVRLHRAGRRQEARERLRSALRTFERLRARPWVDRTRRELRAAGAIEREPVYGTGELTAQEIRVAAAVARGATNKEVAAELFLSPKTIEYHLGRVYRKLGIHSRTELAGLAARGALEAGDRGPTGSGPPPSRTATGGRSPTP